MSWFKRSEKGIQTKTEEKKDIPKGFWYKTPTGKKIIKPQELASNFYVSPEDDYHVHIGSKEYFEILFDDNHFKELNEKIKSKDFLSFQDSKICRPSKRRTKEKRPKRRHSNCSRKIQRKRFGHCMWILLS